MTLELGDLDDLGEVGGATGEMTGDGPDGAFDLDLAGLTGDDVE
jgi:hypothetical protein